MNKEWAIFVLLLMPCVVIAQPVSEELMLDTGDTQLIIEVKGEHREAPLLLVLHGGPGSVVLGLLAFQSDTGRQLEKDYLVAYLHQRGVGKSSDIPDTEHKFSHYVGDVTRVVNFLTEKYGKSKLHIIGHSWVSVPRRHLQRRNAKADRIRN